MEKPAIRRCRFVSGLLTAAMAAVGQGQSVPVYVDAVEQRIRNAVQCIRQQPHGLVRLSGRQ